MDRLFCSRVQRDGLSDVNFCVSNTAVTRSYATAKSTTRPACLVGVAYFMTFLGRKSVDG